MALNGNEMRDLAELRERRTQVESLLRTDGWKLLESMLEATAASAYKMMTETTNPHECAKHMGAWHATRHFITWPARELQAIDGAIEGIEEEARARVVLPARSR